MCSPSARSWCSPLEECHEPDRAEQMLKTLEKSFLNLDEEFLCRWGRLFKDRGDEYTPLPWSKPGAPLTRSRSSRSVLPQIVREVRPGLPHPVRPLSRYQQGDAALDPGLADSATPWLTSAGGSLRVGRTGPLTSPTT